MRKKIQHIIVVITLSSSATYAQVGIGNANPALGAILDLTNPNKGLVLPALAVPPPVPDTGMLYFDTTDYILRYNDGGPNYNGLSPWKFKYGVPPIASNDVYYDEDGNVGIGVASPSVKLTIDGGTDAQGATGNNGYLLLGDFSSAHLLLDDDEIIAKSDANTSAVLNLQNDGGSVAIGGSTAASLTVSGNVNTSLRIQEDNVDLLPAGTIVMWYTATVPSGWGLCDGTTYTKTDGTGSITSPNLSSRFIVATGTYTIDNTGGENSHTLTVGEMPAHDHGGSTGSAGAHTHTVSDRYRQGGGSIAMSNLGSNNHADNTLTRTTSSAGAHTHTISSQGSGTAHENRPPYYALTFIMKL